MRLLEIELTNWQPYKGAGKNARKVSLDGKNGEKNLIIYGQNTHGKTALWQAIRFAMFGRVQKRISGVNDNDWKPLVASETKDEPLLNVTAHEEGTYDFGVRIKFEHNDAKYELDRSYSKKSGITIPRRNSQMEQTFTIRNLDTGSYVQEKQKFVNDILPEELARFFMFDGERIREYRDLFRDTKDVHLRNYIEAILRFPVLTQGSEDFEKMERTAAGQISKHAKKHRKGEAAQIKLSETESNLEVENDILTDYEEEQENYTIELGRVNEWLKSEEEGKRLLDQQDGFQRDKEQAIEEIESIGKKMSKALPGAWRAIITNKIESRLERLEKEIERQKKQTQRQGEIKTELNHLNNRLHGRDCSACGTTLEKPSRKEEAEILEEKVELENEHEKLEKARLDPDPDFLYKRQKALTNIKYDMKLDMLISLEEDLLRWKNKKRVAVQNFDKASKNITKDQANKLAENIVKQRDLYSKIGIVKTRISDKIEVIQDLDDERDRFQDILGVGGGKKPTAYRKAEIKKQLLQELKNAWDSVTAVHRENQRKNVEETATDVFLKLSEKRDDYKKLNISENFQLSIINNKNKSDSASQGQWALVAYSILDALTTCSGIEFPMVIDTPGRSMDDVHFTNTLEYLLNSKKQVIIFPEGSELLPDVGDESYSHRCAATYQLSQNKKDSNITDIILRKSNLRSN
jgi:DNA sulfur modification protein DndD